MLTKSNLKIGIIGAGKVGSALAQSLRMSGYQVNGIASLTHASAVKLAMLVGANVQSLDEITQQCSLIFIATNDDSVTQVVQNAKWNSNHMVVHMSGSLSLEVLNDAKSMGSSIASLHPIQTFVGQDSSFVDVYFGLDTSSAILRDLLKNIVSELGGKIIDVSSADRALYHASAVMSCGYITAVLNDAVATWVSANLDYEDGMQALARLATSTIMNIEKIGFSESLTGPIKRNDKASVKKHIATLQARSPHLLDLYCSVGKRMVSLVYQDRPEENREWAQLFNVNSERKI